MTDNAYAEALPAIAARLLQTTQGILGVSTGGDDAALAELQADLMHKLRIQVDTLVSTTQKLADEYTGEPGRLMRKHFEDYVILDPDLLHTK